MDDEMKCRQMFLEIINGGKKTILIFIRMIKLFENNWERKRSIHTHEKTIHQEYRITCILTVMYKTVPLSKRMKEI